MALRIGQVDDGVVHSAARILGKPRQNLVAHGFHLAPALGSGQEAETSILKHLSRQFLSRFQRERRGQRAGMALQQAFLQTFQERRCCGLQGAVVLLEVVVAGRLEPQRNVLASCPPPAL